MTFTNSGDIIYAVGLEQEMANPDEDTFGSSFKTFDASDYSLIGNTMSPFVCFFVFDDFFAAWDSEVNDSQHLKQLLSKR